MPASPGISPGVIVWPAPASAENEIRNSEASQTSSRPAARYGLTLQQHLETGLAVEAGGYFNTWGQDQWKGFINYSDGRRQLFRPTCRRTMWATCSATATPAVRPDPRIGRRLPTYYIHRFSPIGGPRRTFGIGFFGKPSAATGLTNVNSGGTAAQLASFEKRHLDSHAQPGLQPGARPYRHLYRSGNTGIAGCRPATPAAKTTLSRRRNFYW